VIATHDPVVAERMPERWEIHSGRLEVEEAAWSR
jgi:ABC-type lipoprotein export system ATPase subunit